MYCPECKKERNGKFCPECGAQLMLFESMKEIIPFDKFCDETKINGDFRESFYHFLMEKGIKGDLTRAEYKKYWNDQLTFILEKAKNL